VRRTLTALLALAATVAVLPLSGCATTVAASGRANGKLQVVAAENFWGSIAAQLGGAKVAVSSIIVNPDTDPHSYEPTAADAISLAGSQLAIVNGIGYDAWATRLIDANPSSGRTVLNVGDLLGLKDGDNPHQWYSPASVQRVIAEIVQDYAPTHSPGRRGSRS
jgi:zinc/manganese transport system substrate-binding protein